MDPSWTRTPQIYLRLREGGLEELLATLNIDGKCHSDRARISLEDDGIYIQLPTNVGPHGNIKSLPIDIFIPLDAKQLGTKSIPQPPKQDTAGPQSGAGLSGPAAISLDFGAVLSAGAVPEPATDGLSGPDSDDFDVPEDIVCDPAAIDGTELAGEAP